MNLLERLEFLLHNRPKHAWGKAVGISKGVIDALWKGNMPGAEKLSPAVRAENLSLTWLLEGLGSPYMVGHGTSDDDCAAMLDELYAERWTTYLLTDGIAIAIVLTQPGSYDVGGVSYLYNVVEVLAGPVGSHTLARVGETATGDNVYIANISSQALTDLIKGRVGSYQLLHADGALLKNATLITDKTLPLAVEQLKCAEPHTQYYGVGNVSSDEMATLENLRRLNPQNLTHIRAVIRSLAQSADSQGKAK